MKIGDEKDGEIEATTEPKFSTLEVSDDLFLLIEMPSDKPVLEDTVKFMQLASEGKARFVIEGEPSAEGYVLGYYEEIKPPRTLN
jgi:hypothetical protein